MHRGGKPIRDGYSTHGYLTPVINPKPEMSHDLLFIDFFVSFLEMILAIYFF